MIKMEMVDLCPVILYSMLPLVRLSLPGMSYSFEFTLKFFGDFKETELTLGILEFTEIKNVTDPVGGE